jgi:hypothetical protein
MSATSKVTGIKAARFQQATAELTIPGGGRDRLREKLANAADPLGMSIYTGTIYSVGESSASRFSVYFIDTATKIGYYDLWPQWAFGLAQAALLAGKDVQLVANGVPFGANLLNVAILS